MNHSSYRFKTLALWAAVALAACTPKVEGVNQWHSVRDLAINDLHLGRGIYASISPTSSKLARGVLFVAGRDNIDVAVHQRTLFVSCLHCQVGKHPNVKVQLPKLARLTLMEDAQADVGRVYNRHLVIEHEGRGLLTLNGGSYAMTELHQVGPGVTRGYWVESPRLRIWAERGQVVLAGQVGHVLLQAQGSARCDLKHLRSQNVWVKAQDQARVWLNPRQTLQALATGKSRVRYLTELTDDRMQGYARDQATLFGVADGK